MTRPSQRNRLYRSVIVCLVLLSTVAGLGTAAAQAPQQIPKSPNISTTLMINEIFDSQNVASEYFELYNNTSANINLSTYVIYNHDGSNPLNTLTDPNIASGQIRAIGPTQLNRPTIAGSGLARTDFLALVNTSPSDSVIDVVNFGNAPDISWPNYERFASFFFIAGTQPFLPEDGTKSIQRWPDGEDTNEGRDFQLIDRSPAAFSCGDPYEDDDTLATAANQNPNTTNLHRICPAAESDYIAINVSSSFTYTLQAVARGTRVDLASRLYDTGGSIVVEDNPTGTRNSTIVFRPSATGTYRLQLYDANNGGSSGPDWLYNFTITQQSAATATPAVAATATPPGCNDAFEPDNSLQEARLIDLNTEQLHTLCKAPPSPTNPDTDWLRFEANGGKVYTMYTKDLSGPVDTIITLFDSAGNILAENDDAVPGAGLASRIDYTFGGTNTYYLRIRDKRGLNGLGYGYTVGFSSTGALPPTGTPTTTPTINPNSPTPTPGQCNDDYEPDGVPETARLFLIGTTQHHVMCPETDADWVRFYARAGKVYTVRTSSLGPGLDTYMFLFDSDHNTVLAEDDDGAGDGVASRIDFYPQRDGYYFAQVKNAGDIGLPGMTYDLSLAVVPGVPVPAGTASPIIAPPVTVTAGSDLPTPTTLVQATRVPIPSPTQGEVQPTPASADQPTKVAPTAVSTSEPPVPQPKPTETTQVVPQPTQPPVATEPPVAEAPTEVVPGVPNTGCNRQPCDPIIIVSAPVAPDKPSAGSQLAPMLFRIFYDTNKNDTFNKGEGIRGVSVSFLDSANNLAPTGSQTTAATGDASLRIPVGPQRVYIPYLGVNMPLTRFPERELHSLWLPPVQLPSRVP